MNNHQKTAFLPFGNYSNDPQQSPKVNLALVLLRQGLRKLPIWQTLNFVNPYLCKGLMMTHQKIFPTDRDITCLVEIEGGVKNFVICFVLKRQFAQVFTIFTAINKE